MTQKFARLEKISIPDVVGLDYQLTFLPGARQEDVMFFFFNFIKHDAHYGHPRYYLRQEHTREGTSFQFNLRDLTETFLGSHTPDRFARYLEEIAVCEDTATEEIEMVDNLYTRAFTYNLSSGTRGRWHYWQLYVPGFSNEEVDALLPKYMVSKSKLADVRPHGGYSKLMKLGKRETFFGKLKQGISQLSETEKYYLSKKAAARYLDGQWEFSSWLNLFNPRGGVNNKDRINYRFMKSWKKPLILHDQNKDWDVVSLNPDPLTGLAPGLEWGFQKAMYASLDKKPRPLPDIQIFGRNRTFSHDDVAVAAGESLLANEIIDAQYSNLDKL